MRIFISLCLWVTMFATPAICADNIALRSFANKNANKFKSEITTVEGVSIGSKITISINPTFTKLNFDFAERNSILEMLRLDSGDLMLRFVSFAFYDPEKEEMVFNNSSINSHNFSDKCKEKGSYVGQNSFGAKAVVKRKECDFFVIHYANKLTIKDVHIKMSPSQFRTIKMNGVQAEIDFIVGYPDKDITVAKSSRFSEAEVSIPVELSSTHWNINGTIEELRWILPGDKKAITIWKRDPSAN